MAQAGQVVIHEGMRVLTHCNTGALATGAYGTALGVLRAAWEAGKRFSVWVDETRPLLQGARLTTWELGKLGIPYTLIPDGAAATLMHQGRVDLVILGADRIAANGDTANKIGTYSVAVLAHHHGIPFYVAAPLSTFDFCHPRRHPHPGGRTGRGRSDPSQGPAGGPGRRPGPEPGLRCYPQRLDCRV